MIERERLGDRPDMKVPRKSQKWTEEEDRLLLDAVEKIGERKWIEVSKCKCERRVRGCRRSGARQHTMHAAIHEGAAARDQEGNVESGGRSIAAGVGEATRDGELGGNRVAHRGAERGEVSRALYELHRTGCEEGVSEEGGIEA